MSQVARKTPDLKRLPTQIWVLGFVSLLMDCSSELVHSLLPIYMVTGLGASMTAIGLIEGVAEATASITKIFSGTLSDWFGRRKFLAALGYGLAAASKPFFPLAPTIEWLAAARFIDRIGKGIRGAPRDALVADISPSDVRGASYGLRQSLDTVGAFLGPLLAIVLMWLTSRHFRIVFWFAVIPALLSFVLIVFAIREPEVHRDSREQKKRLTASHALLLGKRFWMVVIAGGVFALARFSEAFLILRAQTSGLSLTLVPLALVAMNVAYASSAYPVGVLSDRVGRIGLLATGLVLLVTADLVLASSGSLVAVMIGVVFWGLHMGFTQGLFSTLIADTAPVLLRGTAFGIFNLINGVALLSASVAAGLLWDAYGPAQTFLAGALMSIICLGALVPLQSALSDQRS